MEYKDKYTKRYYEQLIANPKLKKADIARELGIPPQNVGNWNASRGVPLQHAPQLAKLFNVSTDYLIGFTDNPQRITLRPLIGKASCGVPNGYYGDNVEMKEVPSQFGGDNFYLVEAEGDSMSPKITNRELIICDKDARINNGDIVHYSLDGESGIKRYKINEAGDTITLLPINPEYDPIVIHYNDSCEFKMTKCVKRMGDL